ncbi:hypothetical protein BGX23_009447 [Mortierella sp. AD031]|nr:hypothetical protein BGX23_009447 [Mortierella sp. AD031]KAG0211986.1 hypothetical protein BGX33_003945 [Mortierella sp. NVP41]
MVVEASLSYASPVSASSSSSPSETAIPAESSTKNAPFDNTAIAGDAAVGVKPLVGSDASSIANITETVDTAATVAAAVDSATVAPTPTAATVESSDADTSLTKEEVGPEADATQEDKIEAVQEVEKKDETAEDEEVEEGEPLSAAAVFAKSLTAVTTTLDPAATQLMDQLRLQEHSRVSNTTLPITTRSGSKK